VSILNTRTIVIFFPQQELSTGNPSGQRHNAARIFPHTLPGWPAGISMGDVAGEDRDQNRCTSPRKEPCNQGLEPIKACSSGNEANRATKDTRS